jgi:hypothetical protein
MARPKKMEGWERHTTVLRTQQLRAVKALAHAMYNEETGVAPSAAEVIRAALDCLLAHPHAEQRRRVQEELRKVGRLG